MVILIYLGNGREITQMSALQADDNEERRDCSQGIYHRLVHGGAQYAREHNLNNAYRNLDLDFSQW